MAVLETKFSVGDVVYFAATQTEARERPCPDCLGSRKWIAKSPAGAEFTFACPRCTAHYRNDRDLSLKYTVFAPRAVKLTIGSVRVDTASAEGNEYMCLETGVGSGSIYRESRLFHTEEEALAHAEAMADAQNLKTDWVVKQYDKVLSLCDYQMESAKTKAAEDRDIRRSVDIQALFDDLRSSETIQEVQDVIENFEFRD